MEQPISRARPQATLPHPVPVRTLHLVQIPAVDHSMLLEQILALIGLIMALPLLVVTAVAVRIASGGPVLYIQERVGRFGKTFKMVKFRTMVVDAEAKTGPVLSSKNDPRVTSIGRILRATHLDELPQLINVLRGEMSFIGPRPERPDFVNQFRKTVARYDDRHVVRPGITGLAQICLPYDALPADKLRYELFYLKQPAEARRRLAGFVLYKTAMKAVLGVMPFLARLAEPTPSPAARAVLQIS